MIDTFTRFIRFLFYQLSCLIFPLFFFFRYHDVYPPCWSWIRKVGTLLLFWNTLLLTHGCDSAEPLSYDSYPCTGGMFMVVDFLFAL